MNDRYYEHFGIVLIKEKLFNKIVADKHQTVLPLYHSYRR